MDADGTGRENSLLLGIELILRQIVSIVKGFSRISDGKIAEKGPGRLCCKRGAPAPSPGQGESPLPGKTEKGKGAGWGSFPSLFSWNVDGAGTAAFLKGGYASALFRALL